MLRLAIAGTGKMGRDIGLYALAYDVHVTWLSRSPERTQAFADQVRRDVRRLQGILDRELLTPADLERATGAPP